MTTPEGTTLIGPVALLALAGLVSGAFSAFFPESLATILNPISALFLLDGSSVHPGLLFGGAVAIGLYWIGERRVWALGIAVLSVTVAWSVAVNTALAVFDIKDLRTLFGDAAQSKGASDATASVKLLAGFAAGFAGALVMTLGLSLVAATLRNAIALMTTAIVGALAGLLIYPFLDGGEQTWSLVLLFVVWQGSVGASIGLWLSYPPRQQPRRPIEFAGEPGA